MKLYGIVGAGGFGREIIAFAYRALKKNFPMMHFKLVFVDVEKQTPSINQYPVFSIDEFFSFPATEWLFNVAIADFKNRRKMVAIMQERGAVPFQIKAESMENVDPDHNDIGEGAIFCGFTTVTANAKIGKFFHANIYSYIAHDCIIGDYVTFAPSVHCNGNVIIEDNVYVGTNVIIREGKPSQPIVIGEGAVLGMGAVVTKNVLPHQTVVGNPARLLERKDKVKAP